MGGGTLANYMGEEGDSCPLLGGLCISTVWDLEACSDQIENSGFFHRLLYSYSAGTLLRSLVISNISPFRAANCRNLDLLRSRRFVRMKWFNDNFMSYLAGYRDTADFAAHINPVLNIRNIRRPCIALNADDDPFFDGTKLPVREAADTREHFILVHTRRGGHLGWFSKNKSLSSTRWYNEPMKEFFNTLIQLHTTH